MTREPDAAEPTLPAAGTSSATAPFASIAGSRRLSDRVAELVLARILEQDLQPGDHLATELELARQFGVSRTVIREAVRSLAARGVLAVRQGVGLTVARVEPSTASDSLRLVLRGSPNLTYDSVHEVRRTIEVELARLAAIRATDDGVARLRRAFERQLAAGADIDVAAPADVAFHRTLATMTGNDLFVIMLDSLHDVMLGVRLQAMRLPGDIDDGIADHRAILDAVTARDAAGARRAMAAHLRYARREFKSTDPVLRAIPHPERRATRRRPARAAQGD